MDNNAWQDEIQAIVDTLPDVVAEPEYSKSEAAIYFAELQAKLLVQFKAKYPDQSVGGALYRFKPAKVVNTLEEDVMAHWAVNPESLTFSDEVMAELASSWYDKPVSVARIRGSWSKASKTKALQQVLYQHSNSTDITGCRSLPEIRKVMLLKSKRTEDHWAFRGEIIFYANGEVEINRQLASRSGGRLRGNGREVRADALQATLRAYSGWGADRSDPRTAFVLDGLATASVTPGETYNVVRGIDCDIPANKCVAPGCDRDLSARSPRAKTCSAACRKALQRAATLDDVTAEVRPEAPRT